MSISTSLAPLVVVLMLVLASCGKEECIAPAGVDTRASTKALPGTPEPGPVSEGNFRNGAPPVAPPGNGGDGIGDDGDDLSDTERNRKKR